MTASFDEENFFRTLEEKRRREGITWRQLAKSLNLSASTFSRLSRGRRPDVDTFLRLLMWLKMPAESFVRDYEGGEVDTDAATIISAALRQDASLRPEDREPLEQIVRVAYASFKRSRNPGEATPPMPE